MEAQPSLRINRQRFRYPNGKVKSDRLLAEQLRTLGAIPPRIEVELVSALDRSGGRMGKLKLLQITPASAA